MKINIHISTYIFLLISFLGGYFEYMYLFLLIIFIHEYGHYIFGLLVGFKNTIINIYPFGGITIFNTDLNVPVIKEFISLIGGLLFQLLFLLLISILFKNDFITNHVYSIIKRINFLLLSFNFMPILPLDGGRVLNIVLDKLFSYKLSNKITIYVSIIFTILFICFKNSLLRIILGLFLIKSIIIEYKNIDIKYNKFLLERYLNDYHFNKIRYINNINYFKRDYIHFINNVYEKKYLSILFDKTTGSMLKY